MTSPLFFIGNNTSTQIRGPHFPATRYVRWLPECNEKDKRQPHPRAARLVNLWGEQFDLTFDGQIWFDFWWDWHRRKFPDAAGDFFFWCLGPEFPTLCIKTYFLGIDQIWAIFHHLRDEFFESNLFEHPSLSMEMINCPVVLDILYIFTPICISCFTPI